MDTTVTKPLLRGHFHQAAFFISLGACAVLLALSPDQNKLLANLVYSLGMCGMFGISALYHRPQWSPQRRQFMRRLDHAGIFLMIAGGFTPVTLVLPEASGMKLLLIIWGICLVGIGQTIFWIHMPKWVATMIYMAAGWTILPFLPELSQKFTQGQLFLTFLGGAFYTIGALSYALKRPVLSPRYFSYHEVFHLLVIFGAIAHFIVIFQITV